MDTTFNTGDYYLKYYEELRSNIFQDPFNASQGRYLLQSRGMLWWLKSVNMLKTKLCDEIRPDSLTTYPKVKSKRGFQQKLSMLLAEIILNIYPEALYV